GGASGIVHAGGAAGNDDAFTAGQLCGRRFAGSDIRVDPQIADFARDQVTVLPARVENGNLWTQIRSIASGWLSGPRRADPGRSCAVPAASSRYPPAPWPWAWSRWPSALPDPAR